MTKIRLIALILFILGLLAVFYVIKTETPGSSVAKPFHLGLDLSGGSHLVYEADVSGIAPGDVDDAMSSLREVIERRVNVFGVSEPVVQVEESSFSGETRHRLIVELPGVTDLSEALSTISETPELDFRIENDDPTARQVFEESYTLAADELASGVPWEKILEKYPVLSGEDLYIKTSLTGRYLERARVQISQTSIGPSVSLQFNTEGTAIFRKLTEENVGKTIAIYLDGQLLSAPVVREAITVGQAEISGQFTVEEAKKLARDLNLGALPVPVELVSTDVIGASLGQDAWNSGITAGFFGLLAVCIFMIVWYRLPGVVATFSLIFYTALMLIIFKHLPVTLTSAGIAGFILSIGVAIDANILIFERLKEELRTGLSASESIKNGFSRAWLSIRDSNFSGLISAAVLFWFGTSFIKGFALVMAIGIAVSMFSALTLTRTILLALAGPWSEKARFLFTSGWTKN